MNKPRILSLILFLMAALGAALLWRLSAPEATEITAVRHARYQCPMHPQIIRDEPGDCPICHMHLQLVQEETGPADKLPVDHAAFSLSDERRQLTGVRSEAAQKRVLLRTLRLPGRLGEDTGSVLAQALEMDGPLLKPGLEAMVWVAGEAGRKARVLGVDRALDSYTRTFGVRLELLGEGGRGLRPGLYGDVRILLKSGEGICIPKEAALDTGERQLVFVEGEHGHFEPREVELGKEGDEFVLVTKGLAAGEKVVVSANFLVDSESRFQAAARDFGGKP